MYNLVTLAEQSWGLNGGGLDLESVVFPDVFLSLSIGKTNTHKQKSENIDFISSGAKYYFVKL